RSPSSRSRWWRRPGRRLRARAARRPLLPHAIESPSGVLRMAFPGTGKIWMNGKLVDWKDANVHIATHVIHYGSAVFEGARCYAARRRWGWGAYLGQEALEQGVDVKVSSWSRMAPNKLPAMAKSAANYANSALIKMEALADGYAEGIALDVSGNISEGSGQNVFMVRDGILYTPPLGSSILGGITRDSVMVLARDLGYTVNESII